MSRIVLDRHVRVWAAGRFAGGGAPWRVVRFGDRAAAYVVRLQDAGARGLEVAGPEAAVAVALVERGLAHPVATARPGPHDVSVVVPAYGRPEQLGRCLAALRSTGSGIDVVVVDDATPGQGAQAVAALAAQHGARSLRHDLNRGPAAARSTGWRTTQSRLVAFVDSDCQVCAGWLDEVVPFFDDPLVAAVAPRIVPLGPPPSALARFEQVASALDMGREPALVRPGARTGFVPSAALVVRRTALLAEDFDPGLRLGEDVDLVWRLAGRGWQVRYAPTAVVRHESRGGPAQWAARRFQYGTSAAGLERRHPGRLAPVRVSGWNAAALGLAAAGHGVAAGAVTAVAAGALRRRTSALGMPARVPVEVVARGLLADSLGVGHALRREWWPLGAVALLAAPRSRAARIAAAAMLAPLAWEWWRLRPRLDPARYVGLRLAADALYGSGVIASALRERDPAVLTPALRRRDPSGPLRTGGGTG